MTILLTGVSGFVGTSLAERLILRNEEVIGVDLVEPKEQFCPFIRADLTDKWQVLGLGQSKWQPTILHFAAQAWVDPSLTDPIFTYRANVQATINVLELAVRTNARLVYPSSEIIYGEADRYPTKEFYTLKPDSPYAASKAAADLMVQQANGRGTKTVVLRSGMGYGPRSPPNQVVTRFILRCMDGKPLLFPDGPVRHPTRDINFIGNFVQGVLAVLDHPEVTGVYNLASGHELDLLTLAERVIGVVGKGQIEFRSDFKYRESEEGKRTWLDCTKAREAFGYDPSIGLDEGLEKTYNWLKDNREKYGW